MSVEVKEELQVGLNTVAILKYEVFCFHGRTFQLAEPTDPKQWELYSVDNGALVLTGDLEVNNADTDRNGNSIKTVKAVINLINTDIAAGYYYLVIETELTTTQTDHFRIPLKVRDFKENY